MVTGAEDVALVLAEHGADGHSAAQSLGAREHVRLDAYQGRRETWVGIDRECQVE